VRCDQVRGPRSIVFNAYVNVCSISSSEPRLIAQRHTRPGSASNIFRLARFYTIDGHIAQLSPYIALDDEAVFSLVLVRLTNLLPICEGAHKFASMAVVMVGLHALKDVLPRRISLGLVVGNLVKDELGGRGGVHGQVDADLPFEEADLVGCGEPRLAEGGGRRKC